MAAERPENAEERLVADALQKAFGGPVAPAAFLAGREAVLAAAALSAEEIAADEELVTAALENAFAVPLAPEVRAEHVAAIQSAADEAAAQKSNVIPLRRIGHQVGRHAAAVAVAVSTLAGGSGVAAASTDALPGQMLYPVKRAVEQVMLTAAWTPTAEARVQTELASRRLDEAEQLLASGASPELVGPLLSEYEQHVAVVEDLAITSAAVEVAVLEVKAEALREQAVAAAEETGTGNPQIAAVPTEAASPAVTTTEPPTSGASEPTTSEEQQQAAPAPAASTTAAPKPAEPADTSSGSTGGGGSSTGSTTTTQPAPTAGTSPSPSPSPSPAPSATPTPNRPPQSEVDGSKPPPGQEKPKPNKPAPSPTSSPTTNPDRAPLSDNEPVYDTGPLAEWEEDTFVDGS